MQQQNKEGALIDRFFEWNDSGASCTRQKGLHIQQKNNYAHFKCKAILLNTLSNYTIVLFKLSHLFRFSFCWSKSDSSYLSKIYGHVKKGIMWYTKIEHRENSSILQYENQKIVAKSITLIHFCSLYWFSTDTFISSDRVKLASWAKTSPSLINIIC